MSVSVNKPRLSKPARWVVIIATCIALVVMCMQLFQIHIAGRIMIESAYIAMLVGLFLPLVFLIFPGSKGGRHRLPWYDVVMACLCVVGPAFIFINALPLMESAWLNNPPWFATVLGILTWALTLEAARRIAGIGFLIVVGVISFYPLFSYYMPTMFYTRFHSIPEVTAYYFLTAQGMFGETSRIFGKILIGFMIFGSVMQYCGASNFLLDLSYGLLKRMRGGPALVAVVASAFFASLSGSAIANVISTGTVTIPAMKKLGFKPEFAASVEAVASNGGPLTPPVMGAVAFVMTGILQVPYAAVCIAVALPMVIYYASVFAQVWVKAHSMHIPLIDASEIPPLGKTLKGGWFYFGAVVILIYLLFFMQVEAWAPLFASLFLIVCSFFRKETRPKLSTLPTALIDLGKLLAFLCGTMAAVGLIMGSFTMTGTASSLSGDLVVLAGGNMYALILMGAVGAFILGMGMPGVACYLFMAMVFGPSLVAVGVPAIASHLFFVYWATIGFITPPVCPTVFAAAAIAGSPAMKTGWVTVKLAAVVYIIPILFVLNRSLLAMGSPLSIIYSLATALIGGVLFAPAIVGYIPFKGHIGQLPRILILCVALFMFALPMMFVIP